MALTVAAAPTGARVGITAAGGASRQLLITVAPKVWRPGRSRNYSVATWPAGVHHDLTLYELDRLHVEAPDEDMRELITRMSVPPRHTQSDGDLEWTAEHGLSRTFPGSPRPRISGAMERCPQSATTDLLELFDRLDLLAPRTEGLDWVPAGRSPLHLPLLYRRLLDKVIRRIHSARRGYRAVTRTGGVIRGRVDLGSLDPTPPHRRSPATYLPLRRTHGVHSSAGNCPRLAWNG